MKKLLNKTWGSLPENEKELLLQDAYFVNGVTGEKVTEGGCIVDLTRTVAVLGKVICLNKEEGDYDVIIDDSEVMYQTSEPMELSLDNGIHFVCLDALDEEEEYKITTYWDSIISFTQDEAREKINMLTDTDTDTLEGKIEYLKDYLSVATDNLILG